MPSEPLLQLTGATVVKGGVRVLNGLTLTIHERQHTAILGPNGSGKTTLLNLLTHDDRALAEIDQPPAVRVLGRDRWHVFDLRKQLGIVSAGLHQRFVAGHSAGFITGEDAVVSGFFATQGFLVNCEVTGALREQARAALARVDALHLGDKTVNEMSTGEARRVLIARALVTGPKALVLDEPTTGLDVVARHTFLETVRSVAREGTTVVLITHHVDEIIPEVQQVILLDRGTVYASGAPGEMLTADRLSALFGARLRVEKADGFYHVTA